MVRDIEKTLIEHPDVAEVCVVSVSKNGHGKESRAFVVLHEGAQTSAESLLAFCNEQVPQAEQPKGIHVLEALPKGRMGIVSRRALVELALNSA